MLGWLMAIFPICQFIFTPILGQFSDKLGRKRILIASILGTAFAYLLFAFGLAIKNLPILFIARMIDGISGANISTAQAIIGDISEPHDRARNFGLIGMALGLGFILGPFFGGKLSDPHAVSWFNSTTPFYFAAAMSIINFILVNIMLPETLHVPSTKKIELTRPLHNIKQAFLIPGIFSVIFPVFLFNTGFAFFTTFLVLY
jgi:DHA1 family tetracycline resistance protein-like MFS transporter